MELRVLHAAAYLHTWYGKWGYDVGRGPFNISKKTWKSTVALVHNTPMTAVLEDFNSCVFDPHIGQIIDRYQVCINRSHSKYSRKQLVTMTQQMKEKAYLQQQSQRDFYSML